jgi:hypothetical protein
LLVPEGAHVVSAGFCDSDAVFLQLDTDDVQFVTLDERPWLAGIQQPSISGPLVATPGGCLVVCQGRQLQYVTPQTTSRVVDLPGEVEWVRVVGTSIVFVGGECVVYKGTIEERKEVFAERERVCGLEVSASLGVVVVATEDSFLNVHSLASGELTAVIDLKGGETDRFLVTPFWGFVVVLIGLEVTVFTINGDDVGRMEVETEVREWIAYSDQSGFDFVAFVDVGNRIGVFEPGAPGDVKWLSGRYSNLLALWYMEERKCIAGIAEEGMLALYPLQ